ncbi:MAG: hypothetical protein RQ866_04855, partial [Bacteroidales bacterium]|nr:hypothetical protein [Bacteroidales bacterium]
VYRDQGLGVGGLVVMDDRFNIIPEPFPSYIKMYNATLLRNARKKIDAVRILHEQCMNLYKEAIIQKGIPST